MQSLYSLKTFRKKILGLRSVSEENSMLKAINELFTLYDSKKKKTGVIDPKKFISLVKQNNQEFNNEDHHDSHEFLIWLLDSLHENIKNENKKSKTNFELV
jgi:ubiquitin C-terminal hydrolase